MIYKEHTRNQKRMYRIHKQEEQLEKDKYIIGKQEQEIERLQDQLQQKENIIKEVRKYIETIVKSSPSSIRKDYANMLLIDYKKVLEILDKGE